MEEPLSFQKESEWRTWLKANHNAESEAWLIHFKKKVGTGLPYREAVDEALCFGWIDGKLKSLGRDRFMVRYSPRRKGSVWSKINRDRAEALISQGRMTAAGMAEIIKAKESGRWDAAYSDRVAVQTPADLHQALISDPKAERNFAAFPTSYRNMLARYVIEAKRTATRRKRIEEVTRRALGNIRNW